MTELTTMLSENLYSNKYLSEVYPCIGSDERASMRSIDQKYFLKCAVHNIQSTKGFLELIWELA